jgi:hypothetical protein
MAARPKEAPVPTLPRHLPGRLLLGFTLAVAAVTLAGCTPAATSIDALDAYQREQTDADLVPADVDGTVLDAVDPASTRFLTEVDGTAIYAARPAEGDPAMAGSGACLVLVSPEPMAGCSGGGLPVTVSGPGPNEYSLSPRMPDDEGWTELVDGLWTRAK